jgi:hypothetical protein
LEGERFTDPQPSTPQQHNQRAKPMTVRAVADRAHDSRDLLNVGGSGVDVCCYLKRSPAARARFTLC